MRLPRFELKRPGSLDEAAELLREYGGTATLAAGGTDLFPRMKYRLSSPDVLVSLKRVAPAEPTTDSEGNLHIDALMKLADMYGRFETPYQGIWKGAGDSNVETPFVLDGRGDSRIFRIYLSFGISL